MPEAVGAADPVRTVLVEVAEPVAVTAELVVIMPQVQPINLVVMEAQSIA